MNSWRKWLRSRWIGLFEFVLAGLWIVTLALRTQAEGWRPVILPILIGAPILLAILIGLGFYERRISRRFGAGDTANGDSKAS